METVNLEQGSKEWHEYRRTKVGASEISYLFGCNPFCKAEDQEKYLIGLKLGFNTIFQNSAMKAGHDNEKEIVEYVEYAYDMPTQPLVGHTGNISASFDGITLDHDMVIEVKFSDSTYDSIKKNIIPDHYELQVQQQLLVSGAEKAVFAAMQPQTRDIVMIEIFPDEAVHKEIVSKVDSFFERMNSKEWTENDFNEERTDDLWLQLVDNYREAKLLEEEAKQKVKSAKDALIELSVGVRASGGGASVYPVKPRETINYKQIIKDNGIEIDDKYKKVGSPSWSVRLS